jgi:hypothetical protein
VARTPAQRVLLLAVALALGVAGPARAATVTYGFDSGDQGWRTSQTATGSFDVPTWTDTGGNPGGFISAADAGDEAGCAANTLPCDRFYFLSPALDGGMADDYGGTISFDLGLSAAPDTGGVAYVDSAGGAGELRHAFTVPGDGFQHVSLPLSENGWAYCPTPSSTSCLTASAASFRSVLGDAGHTDLMADLVAGTGETYSLDNFTITEPPPAGPAPAPPGPGVTPTPKPAKCKAKRRSGARSAKLKKRCKATKKRHARR